MDLLWLLEEDPDFLSFMGAVEAAALRTLCKTTQALVEGAPEHAFEFTFAVVIPLLPNFGSYQELEWVILRLRENNSLVQLKPSPAIHRRALYRRWRSVGIDPARQHRIVHRRALLESLIRAFWCQPDVEALLAVAIRLKSTSLLRRLAVEAPGEYLDDDGPNNDGTANFLYKVWVKIEQDHFQEHGRWEPLGRDEATLVSKDLFFGSVHFMLWKYMAGVRKQQQRVFKGYCHHCDFIVPGVISDARCPRE